MTSQRVFVVLAIFLSSYHYGMADENSAATTPGIRGSLASTGRIAKGRTGGRRDRLVDTAAQAPNITNSTIPRREEHDIRVEKRLLWRNETPLDDDFAENDRKSHGSIRPGLISTTLDRFHQEVLDRTDSEGDESVADAQDGNPAAMTIEVGAGLTIGVGNETTTEDGNGVDESGVSEGDETAGRGDNEDGTDDEMIETVIETNDGNATFGGEFVFEAVDDDDDFANSTLGSEDCSWSFSTGTGCSTSALGEIINGYQHDSLIADGECRYNDFLGYYRAGCKREFIDPNLELSVAKVVLSKVFCRDPNCSMGCLEESSVRPNSKYTSHVCYQSSYYNGQGSGGFVMNSKNSRDLDFSFEFTGGCLEQENCNVIE